MTGLESFVMGLGDEVNEYLDAGLTGPIEDFPWKEGD
jgi:hypothetical protein